MADKDDRNNPYNYSLGGNQGYFSYNTQGSPAHANTIPSTPSSPAAYGGGGGAAYASHNNQMYNSVRYPNHMHLGQKLPGHVMQSPQHNHAMPQYQQHLSHAPSSSGPAINSAVASVNSLSGPHHSKQVEAAISSRQAASPHHHARVAAAAARTGAANMDTNGTGASNSAIDPNAKASEWTIIDLGGMSMKNLSRNLFGYTFLTTLYLNHNVISTLPPDIAQLTSLIVLDLTGNRLSSLPAELGTLINLKELLLFDNELTFLPPELGQLYKLEMLGLEGNPLNEPVGTMVQKEGTTAVITYLREMCPVGAPPPDREWITLDEGHSADSKDAFTVMCYNMLADKYTTPQVYPYAPSWVLDWNYRKDLLLQDILNYSADIVCLQEIQMDHFEDYFSEELAQMGGYEGIFFPKSRARTMVDYERRSVDGCATFWKSSKFSLVEKQCIEFQQVAMAKPELRKADDVFNRVMIKDNIATLALLENKETHARILTANAHLHWDPSYKDVKLVQTAMLMEELERYGTLWARSAAASKDPNAPRPSPAEITRLPLLLCGDFNSLPDSGVFEFLSTGRIPQDHPDFGTYTYGPYTSEGLHHKFSLKSTFSHSSEVALTNFVPTFKGVIDYIWYSTATLNVTGLLSGVDKGYLSRTVGFPNAHHPSDHLLLVASFKLKPASAGGPRTFRFQ